ncbi:hypothetical protein OQZ33_09585 [Pedobacter sp. MC2016-05]|uniref:hypothetical protein n=1 Tax=Pedobacter sp. MC2016-05 TaxID=2994474 RepID=UPI0022467A5D|nr:hypothetical protein [Pedobacter sp. MC2016-05]MCX2474577.1 hypothetical protein [Pedobacter sp. MC2016-05]
MSIYFQYPAISDYPSFSYYSEITAVDAKQIKDEDKINREEIIVMKDFLSLKPV